MLPLLPRDLKYFLNRRMYAPENIIRIKISEKIIRSTELRAAEK